MVGFYQLHGVFWGSPSHPWCPESSAEGLVALNGCEGSKATCVCAAVTDSGLEKHEIAFDI